MVALPFIVDGSRVGALTLCSRESDLVSEEELRLLQEITANLSFALQYRQKEDAFQLLAYFDPLTGLAKRALFCERLDELLIGGFGPAARPVVVAFDVDRLSHVNDSFGRHVGDLLLQKVAERVKHQLDDDDRLGYLGGGTFAMVLPLPEASDENATSFLDTGVFRDAVRDRRAHDARVVQDRHRALRWRRRRRQHARAARGSGAETGEGVRRAVPALSDPDAQRARGAPVARASACVRRSDEEQFVLYYQPQVNVETGHIDGVEALLRWQDPQEGLVAPARFLPVLESSGMIVAVGEWVLRKAADDCRRWQRLGLGPRACLGERVGASGAPTHVR